MTSKAALIQALLEGKIVNIKNGFTLFGITNVPREIGRCVERPFGVIVSRLPRTGKSRYGQPVTWVDYRLNPLIENNKDGIKKMMEYVAKQSGTPKTEKEQKASNKIKRLSLL